MIRSTNASSLFSLGLLAAAALALTACGMPLHTPPEETPTPPPSNRVERVPHIQNPMFEIWRPGYWAPGVRGDFVWVPGEVIARPAPTAVWSPARWVKHTYGWSFQQGHWQ